MQDYGGIIDNEEFEVIKRIEDKDFEVVFASDLKRAVKSAEISFGSEYKIIQDNRLRECDYGKLTQVPEEKVNYNEHVNQRFPQGESLKQVETRIRDFLQDLKENYNNKHVAIVAHKAPQLALEVITNNKSWEQAIEEDWRKKGNWQPGWNYIVK